MDVKAHLRARATQAGALLAMVVGGVAVAPAVAFADPPDVRINLPGQVLSGGTVTMTFSVTPHPDDNGPGQGNGPGQDEATVRVSGGMDCNGDACSLDDAPENGGQFSVQLKAPDVGDGQSRQIQVQVTATFGDDRNTSSASITVKGPDRAPSVAGVTGTVKDQDGRPLSGAAVGIQDSNGFQDKTTTNSSGRYAFRSSDNRVIAPGNISVGASKDGYDVATVQRQGQAGSTLNVSLTLKKLVAATPSATPSASASATTDPTEDATEDAPTDEASAPAEVDAQNTSASDDGGGASWIYIVIGGLLVAAGIGAMVLVFLRRKNGGSNNDGDDDDPSNMNGPGGAVPPSQGRFNDATRVGAPVGGGAAAQTMVAPRTGAPMADAPTMLQRPVPADDEFPDPYGAPMPPQGGYVGAASGGWDDQAGYDQATQYGGSAGAGGYGDQAGYDQATQYGADEGGQYAGGAGQYGAGQPQAYNEPTGMYRPATDEGYDDYDRGGYAGGAAGAAGAYGGSATPGGQYGGAASAGAAGGSYGGGAYGGSASAGSYGDQGGYDQATQYGGRQAGGTYGGSTSVGGQYGGTDGQYDAGSDGQYGGGGQYGGSGGQYGGGQYAGQAGYDDPAGHDQGGYDQRGAGQPYGGGGAYRDQYDEQGGYDQRGAGHRGQPRPEPPSRPGQRRSAEWDN